MEQCRLPMAFRNELMDYQAHNFITESLLMYDSNRVKLRIMRN